MSLFSCALTLNRSYISIPRANNTKHKLKRTKLLPITKTNEPLQLIHFTKMSYEVKRIPNEKEVNQVNNLITKQLYRYSIGKDDELAHVMYLRKLINLFTISEHEYNEQIKQANPKGTRKK